MTPMRPQRPTSAAEVAPATTPSLQDPHRAPFRGLRLVMVWRWMMMWLLTLMLLLLSALRITSLRNLVKVLVMMISRTIWCDPKRRPPSSVLVVNASRRKSLLSFYVHAAPRR